MSAPYWTFDGNLGKNAKTQLESFQYCIFFKFVQLFLFQPEINKDRQVLYIITR